MDVLLGRVGEPRLEVGVPVGILVGVEGVGVGAEFNDFNAARCGRGLMGRAPLSVDEETAVGTVSFSFSSSSELLKRRRVPARTVTGDKVLGCSEAADLGRYLGNEEETRLPFFERSVAARARMAEAGLGVLLTESGLGGRSSEGDLIRVVDTRPRVEAFESGVAVLIVA